MEDYKIEEKQYLCNVLKKGFHYSSIPSANENYKYNEDEINDAIDDIYNPTNLKSKISDNDINFIENILVINMKKINKLNLNDIIILIEQFTIEYNLLNELNVNYTDAIKLFFKNNLFEILKKDQKDQKDSSEFFNKFFVEHIPNWEKMKKECKDDYETCYYKYTK